MKINKGVCTLSEWPRRKLYVHMCLSLPELRKDKPVLQPSVKLSQKSKYPLSAFTMPPPPPPGSNGTKFDTSVQTEEFTNYFHIITFDFQNNS